jgi:ATP-dependent Clp protease ATP-binding subunit ClpA
METNFTPQLQRILKMAALEADRDQSGHIGCEHILSAMTMEGLNPGADMIQHFGLTLDDVRRMEFTPKPR